MSKIKKLLERIERCDPNLTFDDLTKVLEYLGYTGTYPKGGSSHCTFRKTGCPPVTLPRKIKRAYIALVADILKVEVSND